MKSVRCDLSENFKELKIELFFDLHIGSRKCNYKMIQDRIETVKNSPNTYCILGGDIINNSILGSVAQADLYESELSPMKQIEQAVKLFKPIKAKILCVTAGNHERRTYKQSGIDIIELFCDELGILDKYDYASCLLFIRFGNGGQHNRKTCYTALVSHGDGIGGKTVGGKANGLQKRGQIVNADLVITGHTHQPLTFRDAYFDIDYANSCFHKKEQVFVNAAATLDYEQYAELYGMKPSPTKSPVIILSNRKKHIDVVL